VVHGLPSSQFSSLVQQSATAVNVQTFETHVSVVQADASEQPLGPVQQPEIGDVLQVCVARSQLSAVQTFESLQSLFFRQHSATCVFSQSFEVGLQASDVHGLPSAQSPSSAQQFSMGTFSHLPSAAQLSVVQSLPSAQSPSFWQQKNDELPTH
jgi:hypothetical protein